MKITGIISAALAAVITAALLSSCGDGDGKDSGTGTGGGTPEETVNINAGTAAPETEGTTPAPEGPEVGTSAAGTETEPNVPQQTEPQQTDAPDPGVTDSPEPPQTDKTPVDTEANQPGGDVTPAGQFGESDLSVVYAGVKLAPGMDFLPYVDVIGDAEIEEGQACIGGGFDTNYYYGDKLAVYTMASDGKQIIYDIYITDTGFTTSKGAAIGKSTRDEVNAIYGQPTTSRPAADEYSVGGSSTVVVFTYSGGVLESIDYMDSTVA